MLKQLKKGDLVNTLNGVATVACVIKSKCSNRKTNLVKYPTGLLISPYHPVKNLVTNKWIFPADEYPSEINQYNIEHVYNFVLTHDHTMFINGMCVCTLGHGFTEDVVKHDYFGGKVIDDLKILKTWHSGLITLPPKVFIRTFPNSPIDKMDYNQFKDSDYVSSA